LLKISGLICIPKLDMSKIVVKSGTFWKRNNNVSICHRYKIQKPLNLSSFPSTTLLCTPNYKLLAKVRVTFCDPGTFKLKLRLQGQFISARILKFKDTKARSE